MSIASFFSSFCCPFSDSHSDPYRYERTLRACAVGLELESDEMRAKEETEADEREDGANVGIIVAWLRNYDGDALSMFTSSVGGPDEAVAII